ncbi:MAG: Bax inhibitor-1/YccA family protein [Alphaproteobacteria bacterium]|mgnify:CR=1 FL=1|nr:Bax inhibitor-1/YccA family protein [Alphaproteobacteria bacterium]MDX5369141.1 Bax inhibitor-1/YccA family protein [Alphaproteobacteria bacterium]MDX5463837.1 Bax inhibitor-1/YccA family protein [Alphaproteobacteria bacterium]
MANYERRMSAGTHAEAGVIDQGLRSYMLRVYNYMGVGLALTGAVALLFASTPALYGAVMGTPLMWVAMLAPLGLVFFLSFRIHKMSFAAAQTTFWIYAAVNGIAFSTIFLVFSGESIARTFFITAAMFGAMSLWGYTTKRDLTGMGSFLFMGLIGLIIAMIVNIFLASSALQFAISVIGVLIFTGLTAYDTQAIKEMYAESDGSETAGKKAIMGALRLYLDFVNLFMMLLQFFGNRE